MTSMIRRRELVLSEAEIMAYLKAGPNDRVAFVPAKSSARSMAETLAAMANANGGLVLIGVTQRGSLQSAIDPQEASEAVVEAGLLADPPLILPSPQAIECGRGVVVAAQIPSGLPHIYSLQGLYLTRTAGQNRPLTTPELRGLLLERSDSGFEAQPVAGASLRDLDEERMIRYLDQIAFAPDEDVHQALLARGCVAFRKDSASGAGQEDHLAPTAAGILLFGRNPQQFLRSAEIVCVRYGGANMGDEFVRQDIGGALADQIRQAEAFVVGNMRRGMRISGFGREESNEYPIAVVREAIVNAVAHRDYSIRGEGIRVLMFSNRMEIYSPGRLPGHVTLENLIDERYSRNEAVVAVLSDMGFIERLGYGIDRMVATMEENGLPAPVFEETSAGFKVTLESAGADFVNSEADQKGWDDVFLNERQEQALAYVQSHGRITNSDYQTLAPDVSAETIRRDLADLVDKNLLLRIGEKRATYYILK